MKNVRILVACLSLIIAGVLFNTSTAYAMGNGSKGGDSACTTQMNPYGQPIIRCTAPGSNKQQDSTTTTPEHHHWHHHHHFFYRSWCHHHFHHHSYHHSFQHCHHR